MLKAVDELDHRRDRDQRINDLGRRTRRIVNPFRLKAPCDNCPFLKEVRPYLQPRRIDLIERDIREDRYFPCHKTTTLRADHRGAAICAGSIKLVEKMDLRPRFWRMGVALNIYQPGSIGGADVYDNFEEMRKSQETG